MSNKDVKNNKTFDRSLTVDNIVTTINDIENQFDPYADLKEYIENNQEEECHKLFEYQYKNIVIDYDNIIAGLDENEKSRFDTILKNYKNAKGIK